MTRMPESQRLGSAVSGTMRSIMVQADEPMSGDRTVMGFVLPSWQRGSVWNRDQQVRFVESAWLGTPLGTYTVNRHEDLVKNPEIDGILLDGQQRLTAIEAYLNGEFEVFGSLWEDVEQSDKIRFKSTKFPYYETRFTSDAEMRRYYDLMNFGGVAHEISQSATLDLPALANRISRRFGDVSAVREGKGQWSFGKPSSDDLPADVAEVLFQIRRDIVLEELSQEIGLHIDPETEDEPSP